MTRHANTATMTPERREASARNAAAARWGRGRRLRSIDIVMNVVVWLVITAVSLGGILLLFIAVTKGRWLLLIPATPLLIMGFIIRDKMKDDSA